MKPNPFSLNAALSWLAADQVNVLPRMLERILEVAATVPRLYEELPWLKDASVLSLLVERTMSWYYDDPPLTGLETVLTNFFSVVTEPVAAMIEALYTAPLLRDRRTVGEILRRMAQEAGAEPLAQNVVNAVCANFLRRRWERLGEYPMRPLERVWQINWQQTAVRLRAGAGIKQPFVALVCETETNKVLAFRCTLTTPDPTEIALTLYEALVFPDLAGRYPTDQLAPPAQLLVQAPLPGSITAAAKLWHITATEISPQDCGFLRQVDSELLPRIVEPMQYLHILDRACERAYGYAPLQAKRKAACRLGWNGAADKDPLTHYLGLRELLPYFAAVVGNEGALEWRGMHYRDNEENVLRYFAGATVTVQQSPLSEALIAVYWRHSVLCYAIADELRHSDGGYRPYWFPYASLGE